MNSTRNPFNNLSNNLRKGAAQQMSSIGNDKEGDRQN
jgi:hypothetical protein